MKIQENMVASKAVSTFLILLTSSCLATQPQETGCKGGRPPPPVKLEPVTSFLEAACKRTYKKELCYESLSPYASIIKSNPRTLCTRASWVALQGLSNITRVLSDLKGQPAELRPPLMPDPDLIDGCNEDVALARSYILDAVKDGPMQDDSYYDLGNRYNSAMAAIDVCIFRESIHEVTAAYDMAIFLMSNARDLCS